MTVLLTMGLLLLLAGAFFWWVIWRSKDPENLVETTGELIKSRVMKNVPARKGYRRYITIKRLVRYTYRYTVNGRIYKLRGELHEPLRHPRWEGRIVYLRGFPRLADLERFTARRELPWAVFLTFVGIIHLGVYVVAALT